MARPGDDARADLSDSWVDMFVDWSCKQVNFCCSIESKSVLVKYVRSFCHNWLHGEGKTYVLPLDVDLLLGTGVVSRYEDEIKTPFLIDGLYFSTYSFSRDRRFICESFLGKSFLDPVCPVGEADSVVRLIFPGECEYTDQMRAVYTTLLLPWVVITGGPGTGKTTTLIGILNAFYRLCPSFSIALCAPTGKAAMNLINIFDQVKELFANSDLGLSLSGYLVQTIHRLLGYPHRCKCFPLTFDVVIVDESSMLDVCLMKTLMNRMKKGSRLILLGDSCQLGPVQGGSVFREIVNTDINVLLPSGINLSPVITLKRNYRFLSKEIPLLAESILSSNIHIIEEFIFQGKIFKSDIDFVDPVCTSHERLWSTIVDGYSLYEKTVDSEDDIYAWFDALFKYRVLCAVSEGSLGTKNTNRVIGQIISKRLNRSKHYHLFFSGTPLMVLKNTPDKDLYNGDVGIFHWQDGQPGVFFVTHCGARFVPWHDMPLCQEAWAITVHKSQGSQFSSVAILVPPGKKMFFSRVWLYTAVTRAKKHILLCCSQNQLFDFFL
ncbi:MULTISPECIES: ATP-dependent DNA helicase [Candidatus Ichthyocystis]|uniref:Putative exodeoxyribonuclease V alpha chain n=1 Tax=Candidatus Ichthyocystis hellenicum TaxID=1561003 RepID=A0A0S4M4X1_9BURK|nr:MULTISPECIES: AAA family ATPase [Ichthyocystis]CUT18095.1 putative exodeoxyribonuclease V alpha chain [Candidatus Ichthyocystis hellenicum]